MAARKDYAAKRAAQQQAEAEKAKGLTINGQPIPDHLMHAIPYQHTDQGIAEESARRKERGVVTPGVSVSEDSWEKRLQQLADDKSTGSEPWEQADPIKAAIARVPDPRGKAFHLFGNATFDREGDRGFQPERDAKGNLIRVGNMVLASMDEERARKREEYYKQLSIEASETHGPKTLEAYAANGVTPLRPGERVEGNVGYSGIDAPATMGHTRSVSAGEILNGG
jgi:hypothetical protein